MPATLTEWHDHLDRHFTALAAARAVSGLPVFALEHGLGQEQLTEISGLLLPTVRDGDRLSRDWLLWVVYATELGYAYAGDEYWDSFNEKTPHWRHSFDRYLRSWFIKFQRAYRGFEPTGPWARHFCRISWPITHAILPRYLQFHFAKALYEQRHQLARIDLLDPVLVGRLLAANAWHAPSRFREFLEQEELAGRIVLSLLNEQPVDGGAIYPPTLARITADLQQVRRAREWLKDARLFIGDRFKGTGTDRTLFGHGRSGTQEGREPWARGNFRPRLYLRRTTSAAWSAIMELPALTDLAANNPQLADIIRNARCKVADGENRWMARGWLAADSQRRVLRAWPDPRAPVLAYERSIPQLDSLLTDDCRISPGPKWLFRIGPDGVAREITGLFVRPGQRYVAVLDDAPTGPEDLFKPCQLECSGMSAVMIDVPSPVSQDQIDALLKFGISLKRAIRIWPAGLSGRNWDGEGRSEWLTTEAPCLGIVHDHPVDSYTLRLDDGSETTISGERAGHPVFVRLQQLEPGRHRLAVRARRIGVSVAAASSEDLEGIAALDVRDPLPWTPGTTAHSGIAVFVDPPTPDLDALWEGGVAISVFGPEGRSVACSVTLTDSDGEEVLSEGIGQFELPIDGHKWLERFRQFSANDARTWKYLEASTGKVTINADELGQFNLQVERNVKPVRLLCRPREKSLVVRLVDDTDSEEAASITQYSFQHPLTPNPVAPEEALSGLIVDAPGGAFTAEQGAYADSLVVSAPESAVIHGGFHGLLVEPEQAGLDAAVADLPRTLGALEAWTVGRLAGTLAEARRRHVVRAIFASLFSYMCGPEWRRAESRYISSPESERTLQALSGCVSARGEHRGFAPALKLNYENFEQGIEAGVTWFTGVAQRYGVCQDETLCRFALRFASDPASLRSAYAAQLDALAADLRHNAVLFRGARLVALRAAMKENPTNPEPTPRWQW